MTKKKEYQFICRNCEGIFTTSDIGQPICRGCWSKTGLSRALLTEMFGYPRPTPLQERKWGAGMEKQRLIKERNSKIEGED